MYAIRSYYDKTKFQNHVKNELVFDLEAEVVKKDGGVVPVFISSNLIDLQGKRVIQGIFRDISKEKIISDLKGELRITSYNVCYTKLLRCIGRTLSEIQFQNRFGATVLAIRRSHQNLRASLQDQILEAGDYLRNNFV